MKRAILAIVIGFIALVMLSACQIKSTNDCYVTVVDEGRTYCLIPGSSGGGGGGGWGIR